MIKKIFIAFLFLLFCWVIYLMQVDPEAEAFFYSYSEQEKEEIDRDIENFLNNKPAKIPVIGDIDPFSCWFKEELKPIEEKKSCASNEELSEIISQNRVLLDKYQLFIKKPEKPELLSGSTLINGKRLLTIKIYLMILEGEHEKTLSLLVADNEFWKKRLVEGASG